MSIEFEEFEYCKLKVNYTADPDLVLEKREEVLESLKAQNVKVPGFRQKTKKIKKHKNIRKNRRKSPTLRTNSKAYEVSLKKQYNHYIEEQVIKQLIAEAYDDTLYETKIKPLAYPQIISSNLDDNSFECEMIFLKRPEFELAQYTGFEIPDPHQKETAIVRAENMLQRLRKQHGTVALYAEDDFLQDGDSVSLDIKSVCEDNIVTSLTGEGIPYTVGENTLAEFDYNVYGMKIGEQRIFDIQFSDTDNINEEIRNKRVSFTVTLQAGTKTILATLDDEFAKKTGYDSYQKLYDEVVGTASSQLDKTRNQQIANQILSRILKEHDFKIPQDLILLESQNAVKTLGAEWDKLTNEELENIFQQSTDKLKLSMILEAIRGVEPDAVFSESEILNMVRSNIKQNGKDPDKVLSSAQRDGTLIGLMAKLKDEATIQWLVSKSTVINESTQPVVNNEVTTNGE